MRYWTRIFFTVLVCFCGYGNAKEKPPHDKKVVCYYASWATWRAPYFDVQNKTLFPPREIDASLCTHLIYVFGGLNSTTQDDIVQYSPYTDSNEGLGFYQQFTSLKVEYPHLKVLLCIGGWNQGSENFSKLARSESKRKAFAKNAVEYLRKYNFDGLDIFWQYPAQRGGLSEDKNNFPMLLQEIKEQFAKHNYILTVFLHGTQRTIDLSYDLAAIGQIVDWVNIYGHGYHTPWDLKFGISAPLDSKEGASVKGIVRNFLNSIPNNKLVLGLATIGFGFKNADQPGKVEGLQGLYNDDKGFLAYHEICLYLKDQESGWTESWENASSTPVAIKGNNKISYDNEESIKLKVQYAHESNLAGVAVWTIDNDDFAGMCSLPGIRKKFPILKTVNQEFKRLFETTANHLDEIIVTFVTHEY